MWKIIFALKKWYFHSKKPTFAPKTIYVCTKKIYVCTKKFVLKITLTKYILKSTECELVSKGYNEIDSGFR